MKLGNFSVSLSVKDLSASKVFYEKLGFKVFAGAMENNYLILKSDSAIIGLFQDIIPGNILTFNPGWDENAQKIEGFEDIRSIQKKLIADGIHIDKPIDENSSGAANLSIVDPDGNVILLDQHV
jgi:catechol 2,3-dioxygenase-like lactoylglutathione lyase family enzyme